MALLKVIELISESEINWEDATQNAVKEASQSMRNIRSVYVKNLTAVVEDGIIKKWRLNCKMTFEKE
jgi:hypothetical protein